MLFVWDRILFLGEFSVGDQSSGRFFYLIISFFIEYYSSLVLCFIRIDAWLEVNKPDLTQAYSIYTQILTKSEKQLTKIHFPDDEK